MADFRFVHAADLHLDTPFQGIARTAPDIARAMRDASLEAWEALVDWTLAEHADFIVIAGDIYDGEERGVRAQLRFRQGLERLSDAGVRAFIVHGNHDPLSGWSAIHSWPEHVTVFGAGEVESMAVDRDGQHLATVHGISYAERDTTENLALRFARGEQPGFHIAALHCNVGGTGDHAPYSPCTTDDLVATGIDYWALGHVHTRRTWTFGDTWIVYPGNLQGRSPKASERRAKGAVVVEVFDGRVSDIRFQDLDRVRFHSLRLDVSELDDIFSIKAALIQRAQAARTQHGRRGIVMVVTLVGRTEVHADLARPATLLEMLEELRGEFAGDDPFLWWDRIRDQTRLPMRLSAIRERDDFLGALLRHGDQVVTDHDTLAAFVERHERALWSFRLPPEVLEPLGGTVAVADPPDAEEAPAGGEVVRAEPRRRRRQSEPVQISLFAADDDVEAAAAPLVPITRDDDAGGAPDGDASNTLVADAGDTPNADAGGTPDADAGGAPDADASVAADMNGGPDSDSHLLRRAAECALDALAGIERP